MRYFTKWWIALRQRDIDLSDLHIFLKGELFFIEIWVYHKKYDQMYSFQYVVNEPSNFEIPVELWMKMINTIWDSVILVFTAETYYSKPIFLKEL